MDDMFNMIDDVQQMNDNPRGKKGQFHNTQQIRTQNYLSGSQ